MYFKPTIQMRCYKCSLPPSVADCAAHWAVWWWSYPQARSAMQPGANPAYGMNSSNLVKTKSPIDMFSNIPGVIIWGTQVMSHACFWLKNNSFFKVENHLYRSRITWATFCRWSFQPIRFVHNPHQKSLAPHSPPVQRPCIATAPWRSRGESRPGNGASDDELKKWEVHFHEINMKWRTWDKQTLLFSRTTYPYPRYVVLEMKSFNVLPRLPCSMNAIQHCRTQWKMTFPHLSPALLQMRSGEP